MRTKPVSSSHFDEQFRKIDQTSTSQCDPSISHQNQRCITKGVLEIRAQPLCILDRNTQRPPQLRCELPINQSRFVSLKLVMQSRQVLQKGFAAARNTLEAYRWLTVAKSADIFYQATFRKPRVYCCTGFYELSQTTARIFRGGKFSTELSVSPEVVALASGGVPIGGKIGPFATGESLESNFSAPEPGIWAARYHQLRVEYIQIATQSTTSPPQNIMLKPDCTHPRGALMGGGPAIEKTREVECQRRYNTLKELL